MRKIKDKIFPCLKKNSRDTFSKSHIDNFISQLIQDKRTHLKKKVDGDMVSMELNNRWKHYLRCQMKLLADEDVAWAEVVNDWLKEEKFFANATFYQNEMIYEDFFSGDSKKGLRFHYKPKRRKSGKSDKMFFQYWKDLEEFEKMEDGGKNNKVRDVFFGSLKVEKNSSVLARKSNYGSLYFDEHNKKKSVLMNRLTLNKIRARNTVLKNINQGKDDSRTEKKEELALFKRVTGLLEQHLTSEDNCFKNLMKLFRNYIVKKYESFLSKRAGSRISHKKYGEICERLCKEINHFIQVLVKSLILFYNFDISKFKLYFEETGETSYVPCDVLNFENLMNFITVLMFPNKVYKLVHRFLKIKNEDRNRKFHQMKNNHKKEITMKSLGVSNKFRLKEGLNQIDIEITTEEIIKNDRKYSYYYENSDDEYEIDKRSSIAHSEYDTSQVKKLTVEHYIERKSSLLANLKKINTLNLAGGGLGTGDDQSYGEAIGTLNYLNLVESPFEKMKVLLLVVRRIIKAINEYYGPKKKQQEVMTGEQLMGLITYVVSKSNCQELVSHLEFVRFFLPKKLSSTFCGYYLTVFECACEYLINYVPKTERNRNQGRLTLDLESENSLLPDSSDLQISKSERPSNANRINEEDEEGTEVSLLRSDVEENIGKIREKNLGDSYVRIGDEEEGGSDKTKNHGKDLNNNSLLTKHLNSQENSNENKSR